MELWNRQATNNMLIGLPNVLAVFPAFWLARFLYVRYQWSLLVSLVILNFIFMVALLPVTNALRRRFPSGPPGGRNLG